MVWPGYLAHLNGAQNVRFPRRGGDVDVSYFTTGLAQIDSELSVHLYAHVDRIYNGTFYVSSLRWQEIPRIGSLCWKTVEEIRYDPRITKVALTMADIVDR